MLQLALIEWQLNMITFYMYFLPTWIDPWLVLLISFISWRLDDASDFAYLHYPECTEYDGKGWEPWSSGYGKRLMLQRAWVRILDQYTVWTFWHFFTLIFCKNCIVCLKRQKINEKEDRVGPFFKKVCWERP